MNTNAGKIRNHYVYAIGWLMSDDVSVVEESRRQQFADEFDAFVNSIKAESLREAATDFVDWDVMYGHESPSADTDRGHSTAAYLNRKADELEGRK